MLKKKEEIKNYKEKAKFLTEQGYCTMYNDDNWVLKEWIEQSAFDYTKVGMCTDQLYNSLTIGNESDNLFIEKMRKIKK